MIEIERVCTIPRDFRERRDRSLREVIDASGYREIRPALTITALQDVLEGNPDLVGDWLRWSEDKRTSGGWAFDGDEEHGWHVWQPFPEPLPDGRPGTKVRGERRTYDRAATACADYILSEIDFWVAIREERALRTRH